MLTISETVDLLSGNSKIQVPPFIETWKRVYFSMSLHIDGACPAFKNLQGDSFIVENLRKEYRENGMIYPLGYYGYNYQYIFETFLYARHPRENEDTRWWRMSQHKPFTKAPFRRIISNICGAMFQDSNYSVTFENREDQDYIMGNNFEGMSLPKYLSSKMKSICEDPNGRFVVIPNEPYFGTTTDKIEPRVYFIPSKSIIYVSDDEIVFSMGDYSWLVNNIGYFRFKKDENNKYIHVDDSRGGYYAHMFNEMPSIITGGHWNTQGFYESWLDAAKAVADEFVSAKSAEQLVNKEASHPFIVEVSEDCLTCGGLKTVMIEYEDEQGGTVTRKGRCSACGGSGIRSRNPGDRLRAPADDMKNELVQIINPDVTINKFHADNNRDLYNELLRALNLRYIEQAQSGTAKDKDLEDKYLFISEISDDVFNRIFYTMIKYITALRNIKVVDGKPVPSPSLFTVIAPTQYAIKTSTDLLEELALATKSSVPDFIRQKHIVAYVDKQFGGDEVLCKKADVINQLDFLSATPDADKQIKLNAGAITKRQLQYSTVISSLLDRVVREKGSSWFLNASYELIEETTEAYFEEYIADFEAENADGGDQDDEGKSMSSPYSGA